MEDKKLYYVECGKGFFENEFANAGFLRINPNFIFSINGEMHPIEKNGFRFTKTDEDIFSYFLVDNEEYYYRILDKYNGLYLIQDKNSFNYEWLFDFLYEYGSMNAFVTQEVNTFIKNMLDNIETCDEIYHKNEIIEMGCEFLRLPIISLKVIEKKDINECMSNLEPIENRYLKYFKCQSDLCDALLFRGFKKIPLDIVNVIENGKHQPCYENSDSYYKNNIQNFKYKVKYFLVDDKIRFGDLFLFLKEHNEETLDVLRNDETYYRYLIDDILDADWENNINTSQEIYDFFVQKANNETDEELKLKIQKVLDVFNVWELKEFENNEKNLIDEWLKALMK